MTFKIKGITVCFLCIYGISGAQEVITTNGDYFSNSNGSLSSTIGEPITETFKGTENIITQGFEQSRLEIISINELPKSAYSVYAFPNPVKEFVTIKCDSKKNDFLLYELYDNSGKLLQKKQFDSPQTQISFRDLKPSDYYIRIFSDQLEIKAFKIVKH